MPESNKYWNPSRETSSLEAIRDLQNEKLRAVISRGYHNAPIIQKLWEDSGVKPEDINSIEDLSSAPLFRKDDARRYMKETGEPFGGRLSRPWAGLSEEGGFIGTSSGTTGIPTNVIISDSDRQVAAECQARMFWQVGVRPGDTVLCWTLSHHLGSVSFPDAIQRVGAIPTRIQHSLDELDRVVHVLRYLEPSTVIHISNPTIGAFEAYFEEHDINPLDVWDPVENIVFGGEPLLDETRRSVEERWGVEMFEFSGGLEPFWFPAECEEHGRWLHVQDDHFYVEAINPDTGEPVADGERGSLVVTPLSYEAMSHVRWAHDDIVEMKRGTCGCGRTGTRIKFLGRTGDLVTVGERALLPYDVIEVTNEFPQMPNNLFQFDPKSEEALRIRLAYASEDTDDLEDLIRTVEQRVSQKIGVPVDIYEAITEEEMLQLGPGHKIPRVIET